MRSVQPLLIVLLLLVAGCIDSVADKRAPDSCGTGRAAQCHGMFDQSKGGQSNGGGMGGGMGM